MTTVEGHGGELALDALQRFGVNEIFTLSGGHIFPIYDACVKRDVPIIDVRGRLLLGFDRARIETLLGEAT
jgi:hypothetical protein